MARSVALRRSGTRIGIIPGGPTIDYANRAYFASEVQRAPIRYGRWTSHRRKIWSTPWGAFREARYARFGYVGDVAGMFALSTSATANPGNFPFDTGGGTIEDTSFPTWSGTSHLSQNTVAHHDDGAASFSTGRRKFRGHSRTPGREFLWVGSDDATSTSSTQRRSENFVTLTIRAGSAVLVHLMRMIDLRGDGERRGARRQVPF
jgi:hypothetical protein